MADINTRQAEKTSRNASSAAQPTPASEAETPPYDLIELLFFAYRDFTRDPDDILAEYGFGRAHHRVLHFVNRNPGMRVTELLDILRITKQSLGRVLKQLVDTGYIEQRPGRADRRQRLLYATEKGRSLALRLAEPQSRRIHHALRELPPGSREVARDFLLHLINPGDREEAGMRAGKV
jgi:DNA-binding MarR family transcriptional regulator